MFDKKPIAIGNSDFDDIIRRGAYYFDKTKFIEDVVSDITTVKLITRPRRFGKTLNMSMLKYFFDVKESTKNRELFNGLYIENSEVFAKQGQHPVLFISFKDIKVDNWTKSYDMIKYLLSRLYNEFDFLNDNLNKLDRINFENIWLKTDYCEIDIAISYLCELVAKHYGKKVVLLIDEYDTPLISAHQHGYYKEAINFFKTLLSTALKDNPYLELAVLTGVVRVANENIFSGLNNIGVYSILDNEYADSFGLTETEVMQALDYYEMKENIDEVKLWYNGYKFGDISIYNPWSITNYLNKGKIGVYWIHTSGNYLIKKSLKMTSQNDFSKLQNLLSGGYIKQSIDKHTSFVDMDSELISWALLLFSGYLTIDHRIDENRVAIKLTNREVRSYFAKEFIEVNFGKDGMLQDMLTALLQQNFNEFEDNLQKLVMQSLSPFDTRKSELAYHMYFLGLISYLGEDYYVTSNQYSGKGLYDIAIEPKEFSKVKTGFIIEFKVVDKEQELESTVEKALKQIRDKQYYHNMEQRGVTEVYGVAMVFCGKVVKVKFAKML